MIHLGIVHAMYPLLSQNYGARNEERLNKLFGVALGTVLAVSMLIVFILQVSSQALIGLFLDSKAALNTIALATDYIEIIWPIFLVNGINLLIACYLTAMQQPVASSIIALLRSLILPVGLLLFIFNYVPQWPYCLALPIAEWATFFIAVFFFFKFSQKKVLKICCLNVPHQ